MHTKRYHIDLKCTSGPVNAILVKVDMSAAASLMGRKSADVRRQKWGAKEFRRRMKEYGKMGGRPKGSTKKKRKRGKK